MARLPVYLRSLLELNGDATTVSSERLAEMAGVNAAKVRKERTRDRIFDPFGDDP